MVAARVGERGDWEVPERALNDFDLDCVVLAGAFRELAKIFRLLKLGKHRLQNALRRRDLARDRLVVRGDELGRARISDQTWTTTPSEPIGADLAASEPLGGPIETSKMNARAHWQPTMCRERFRTVPSRPL